MTQGAILVNLVTDDQKHKFFSANLVSFINQERISTKSTIKNLLLLQNPNQTWS